MKKKRFRQARALAATVLGVGIAAGTAAMLILQRWVAEIDDEEREDVSSDAVHRRSP